MTQFTRPNRFAFRFLCWFLAALMFATPALPVMAQQADVQPAAEKPKERVLKDTTLLADPAVVPAVTPLDLTYLLPQACLVVAARPRQLFATPAAAMMPLEVLQAASIQQTGIDALELETVLVSVEPPMPGAGPASYALLATFANSVEGKLHPQLTAHTQPGQIDGRPYFQAQHPVLPSIYAIDGKTLLAAPEMALQKLVATESAPAGNMLAQRLQNAASGDLYVGVNVEVLRPLINQLMVQAQLPPQMLAFAPAPDLIKLVELRLNFSGMGPTELVIEANNADDAERLVAMLQQVIDQAQNQALAEISRLKQDPDPVQQALGRYQERMINQTAGMILPKQDGARLTVFHVEPSKDPTNPMITTAIVGVLVALLLPAVQAARQAARRSQAMNNVKMILLGLLNHHDARGSFPAYANFDGDKRLLSWRVHLLPFLDEQMLYSKFHLDEPWDSEHNRQLISQMPAVYLAPGSRFAQTDGKTQYLGALGEGFVFSGKPEGINVRDITDGTSNTIAVVQANDDRSVTWTQPADWEFEEQKPFQGLLPSLYPGMFVAGFCDGHITMISEALGGAGFKAQLTRAGGEPVP